jgi:hypothetical protein
MMHATCFKTRRSGLRALLPPATLAVMVAALAVPSRAATVSFNPGNGVQTGISGFGYAPTSVLATPLSSPSVGATYNVYYESVINSTQGNSLPVGSGNNLNNSGNEFTVIAGFRETITGINLVPGGGTGGAGGSDAAIINFSLASPGALTNGTTTPNFFYIFANAPGSANPTTGNGAGFGVGTQVLSGFLNTTFNGSFTENGAISGGGTTFTPLTTTFNTSGQSTTNPTTTSVSGAGGTTLTVQVVSANSAFFPSAPSFLTFSTTNSLPFNLSSAPLTGFWSAPNGSGGSPDITGFSTGTINGENGTSLMFASTANSGFAVPEPSSIIPATTAAMGIPMFLYMLRRRFNKTGV